MTPSRPNPTADAQVYAGVELGGTKIVCGMARGDGVLMHRTEIPTGEPEPTLAAIRNALGGFAGQAGAPRALGIATFGPVRLDPAAADYGAIGPSPKLRWNGVNLIEALAPTCDGPIAIQTDVNGAAIGEATWGAAQGCDPVVYITVGTGIGGGVIANGAPVTGLLHPEVGHMHIRRAEGDEYPGDCPYHHDCVEGLAAGPSIVARWGHRLSELPAGHPAYATEAHYIAHLVCNMVLAVAPRRVVLGGGVMSNEGLFPLIRQNVRALLQGFIPVDEIETSIERFIVPPGLGADAGVLGAIAMARHGMAASSGLRPA